MAKTLKPGQSPTATKSPWHLQGSQLVAIDVETTGLDPLLHEIFQIAVIALDYNFLPRKDIRPFVISMKVENPELINYAELSRAGVKREKLELHTLHGLDQITGTDKLIEWTEKLELPANRRLCVIAQNWPFDRPFIMNWLGKDLFENIFHPQYRDLIPAAMLLNDFYYEQGKDPPHRAANLTQLCNYFEIERKAKHDALADAAATAEIYRRMLAKYSRGFIG